MNTQIATFLFLLASAMGATIIVAKGDIFHAFRAWILSKSKKNKVWVHDVTIPANVRINGFNYRGENIQFNINSSEIEELGFELHRYFSSVKIERLPDFGTRIYINLNSKDNIEFITPNNFVQTSYSCGTYEKSETIKWISFIHDMISCPQCCGVWVGMIWFILYTIGAMAFFVFQMLCAGCIVSLFASLYWKLHDLLNSYTNKK